MIKSNKTLARAVTLSVLLMLPYGMAQAAEYNEAILGNNDNYSENIKTGNNSDGFVYNFQDGDKINISKSDRENRLGIIKTPIYYSQNYKAAFTINGNIDLNIESGGQAAHGIYAIDYYGTKLSGDIVFTDGANINVYDKIYTTPSGTYNQTDNEATGVTLQSENTKIILSNSNISVTAENHHDSARERVAQAYGIQLNKGMITLGNGSVTTTAKGDVTESTGIYVSRNSAIEVGDVNIKSTAISSSTSDGRYWGTKAYGIYNGYLYNSDQGGEFTGKNLNIETIAKFEVENNYNKSNEYITSVGIFSKQGSTTELDNVNIKSTANTINKDLRAYGISSEVKEDKGEVFVKESTNITVEGVATETGRAEVAGIYLNNLEPAEKNTAAQVKVGNGNINVSATNNMGDSEVYGVYAKNGTNAELWQINIAANSNGGNKIENIGIKASGGTVNVNGASVITAVADGFADTENSKVYGIWSTEGGNVTINGTTQISTSGGDDIAVVAGTEEWTPVDGNLPGITDADKNNININYQNGQQSVITGDIISGYAGNISVGSNATTFDEGSSNGTLTLNGNALAGNGGVLNVVLTPGSVWNGRADDYQDVNNGKLELFAPQFSHTIVDNGTVAVDLAQGSRWNVKGQSWVTSINSADGAVIDLVSANTDRNKNAHALTIGELQGNAEFHMSLDGNREISDMLYIKEANGDYVINLADAVSEADINAGGFNGLRFATLGTGSKANFTVLASDKGIMNIEYEVDTDSYSGNKENTVYNGGNYMTPDKPGNTMVDNFFGHSDSQTETQAAAAEIMPANFMLFAEPVAELDEAGNGDGINSNTGKTVTDDGLAETTNYKLTAYKNVELSSAGKTIINMSKVNYNNATYMDRLNKRLGEARYISPEDEQGMWVRLRHDRIGKDNAFRSQNTMYELGYDVKQDCDNGERRVGLAIDYMDGKAEYTGIAGSGDIKRYGLWLYDTWTGDKGHYTDYVAKWGHLENDFDIMAKTTGEKITGDYSNNVFSISAEYGKKNDLGGNWYFEPQAQLQLARVTGANYVTSQNTKVSLDGINSLIGRAGFRLGKDLNATSTAYIKADLLHEFLGEQDISATDVTGTLKETYENKGTWYDIGFGFATAVGKNSYAFVDFEKSFGNDNDETYQINAGVQWTF